MMMTAIIMTIRITLPIMMRTIMMTMTVMKQGQQTDKTSG